MLIGARPSQGRHARLAKGMGRGDRSTVTSRPPSRLNSEAVRACTVRGLSSLLCLSPERALSQLFSASIAPSWFPQSTVKIRELRRWPTPGARSRGCGAGDDCPQTCWTDTSGHGRSGCRHRRPQPAGSDRSPARLRRRPGTSVDRRLGQLYCTAQGGRYHVAGAAQSPRAATRLARGGEAVVTLAKIREATRVAEPRQ